MDAVPLAVLVLLNPVSLAFGHSDDVDITSDEAIMRHLFSYEPLQGRRNIFRPIEQAMKNILKDEIRMSQRQNLGCVRPVPNGRNKMRQKLYPAGRVKVRGIFKANQTGFFSIKVGHHQPEGEVDHRGVAIAKEVILVKSPRFCSQRAVEFRKGPNDSKMFIQDFLNNCIDIEDPGAIAPQASFCHHNVLASDNLTGCIREVSLASKSIPGCSSAVCGDPDSIVFYIADDDSAMADIRSMLRLMNRSCSESDVEKVKRVKLTGAKNLNRIRPKMMSPQTVATENLRVP